MIDEKKLTLIAKQVVKRYDALLASNGAKAKWHENSDDTAGAWVSRRMGGIISTLRDAVSNHAPTIPQKIRWLQDYDLRVENETEFDVERKVRKDTEEVVTILSCTQWGNAKENVYDIQFSDGFIAPGVYIGLFEFTEVINILGDIPDAVSCPNVCDGGDVCVNTRTGKCGECGKYFNIIQTEIIVRAEQK